MTELRQISAEELKEILEKHAVWLTKKDREIGSPLRANLIKATLRGSIFIGADLG